MKHHSQNVLTSHKSHACWPFLTKMSMHSHDLIKATLKSKRKLMRRKEWSTQLFQIATHAAHQPSTVSSISPSFWALYFPMMTSHHWAQQARFPLGISDKCWVCCWSWGVCAIARLFQAKKTEPITSSKTSGKCKSGMIAPCPALVWSSTRCAVVSFPQREMTLSPLIRCWSYPNSKPEPIFSPTLQIVAFLLRKINWNKISDSSS